MAAPLECTSAVAASSLDRRLALLPIDLHHLLSFLVVAETGSFRKAGTYLDVGQSAISRRVQRLEDLLGASLFERRPSGARLTPIGARFAARVRTILSDLDEAIEAAQSGAVARTGELKLGVTELLSSGPLQAVIERFLADHPGVELDLLEADYSRLFTQLSHRQIDLALTVGMPGPETGDRLVIADEAVFLAVRSDHSWACRKRLSWKEVKDAAFIVSARAPGTTVHDHALRRMCSPDQGLKVRRFSVGQEGILSLVGLGLGVSLMTGKRLGFQYPNITFVPIGDTDDTVPFSIAWRPENDNPALRRFISLARIEAKRNGASR